MGNRVNHMLKLGLASPHSWGHILVILILFCGHKKFFPYVVRGVTFAPQIQLKAHSIFTATRLEITFKNPVSGVCKFSKSANAKTKKRATCLETFIQLNNYFSLNNSKEAEPASCCKQRILTRILLYGQFKAVTRRYTQPFINWV